MFSDVHADVDALASIAAAVKRAGIERVWCLGDFCSGGPDPVACFEWTMSNCEVVIGGNHELFVVAAVWNEYEDDWARAAQEARERLGDERVRVLHALPAHGELAPLGVEMVHGSLLDPTYGFIRSAADAYMSFQRATQPLVLYGHTHRSACWVAPPQGIPGSERIPIGYECPLPGGVSCMLNPGAACDSVGARWLELRLDGAERAAVWHQTDTPGHGAFFSAVLS